MRKFKILAVLLFLVAVTVHCETEEIDEIEIETIEEEEPQEPDVVQFEGDDAVPQGEEVQGEEAETKEDAVAEEEVEVEVVPYKYKQRDQMFTRQEAHNCILNEDLDVFVKHLDESDFSTFVYVRDDNPTVPYNEQRVMDMMVMHSIVELGKGYFHSYVFDCQHIQMREAVQNETETEGIKDLWKVCFMKEYKPMFWMHKPSDVKVNPYTGEKIKSDKIPYIRLTTTAKNIKHFMVSNLPDYSHQVRNLAEAHEFVAEVGIHKAFLFSDKEESAALFSAITSHFRNRIRFAFVNVNIPGAEELKDFMQVEFLPQVCVLESVINVEPWDTPIRYYDGKLKMSALKSWMNRYALKEHKIREDRDLESKKMGALTKKRDWFGFQFVMNMTAVEQKIMDHHNAGVVAFIRKEVEETNYYLAIVTRMAQKIGQYINVVIYQVDELNRDELELEGIDFDSLPQMKYYKNGMTGDVKREYSYLLEMPFEAEIHTREGQIEVAEILTEQANNEVVNDNIMEITPLMQEEVVDQCKENDKVYVSYLYDVNKGIDNVFVAISNAPELQEGFEFVSIQNPPYTMISGQNEDTQLPIVQGTHLKDFEYHDEELQQRQKDSGQDPWWRLSDFEQKDEHGNWVYQDVVMHLLKHYPQRLTDYTMKHGIQKEKDLTHMGVRMFGEITTQEEFFVKCLKKKTCAIGFLSGDISTEELEKEHKQAVREFKQLEDSCEKKHYPVYWSWVNTTCHPEFFKIFGVRQFDKPTVVFYNAQKHRQYYMTTAKFNIDTIVYELDKFVFGKLKLTETVRKRENMQMIERECPAHEANESDENFDDILAEILAEEEERKKEQEEDLRYPKKETKKDKKNKKKKNKNKYKAKKKEDL